MNSLFNISPSSRLCRFFLTKKGPTTNVSISASESFALLYLCVPIILFFLAAIRYQITIPATALIIISIIKSFRQAYWKLEFKNILLIVPLFALAMLWSFSSGGLGVFQHNSDWIKHYAMLNLLADQPWWPVTIDGTLRYSLGWYLVPAIMMKIFGHDWGTFSSVLWTAIGVLLFFSLLKPFFKSKSQILIGFVAFALFSGADALGAWVTGYNHGGSFHFEWWAGWIQYAANTTLLFWVPQHALPSWIGIALLLRQVERNQVTVQPALILAVSAFWSPFAAIGLIPFALLVCLRLGLKKTIFNWQSIGATLLIGMPIGLFLSADSVGVPHDFIWKIPCVIPGGWCFSWLNFITFLAIETWGALFVLVAYPLAMRKDFAIIAIFCLYIIPLYRIGLNNDFAMRASIPALCVLALTFSRGVTLSSWPNTLIPLFIFIIGLPVPIGEIYRGAITPLVSYRASTFKQMLNGNDAYKIQYFSRVRPWVLRANDDKK